MACLTLGPAAAQAEQAAPAPATVPSPRTGGSADRAHPGDGGQPIIVVGRLLAGTRDPISAPVVLQGDALLKATRPQIGQMLERLPGVSASGFAPGVSRPILRGFDGPRVQVLLDGLTSLDASSVSADHAVSLDTLNVETIEVLHGPQVLLYAGDPSGGVVNAIDKRIPRHVPDQAVSLNALASYGTAANAVTAGAAAEVRLAPRWVAHLDAGYSRAGDLSIGGNVLSPGLRAQVLGDAAELRALGDIVGADQLTQQANARGKLANSQAKQWTVGGGLAFIDEGGSIGGSVQRLSTDYGIPPRPAAGQGEKVSIALRQTRYDMRAGLNLGGLIDRIEMRGAYGDYRHAELHDGIAGTLFASKGLEARLEAIQTKRGGWSGTSGLQYGFRRLDVSGEEALLPNDLTDRFAAFTLQRIRLGTLDLEAAGRYEYVDVRTRPASANSGNRRNFNLLSGTAGVAWHPNETLNLSVNVSRGARAPSAEELFIDGIHDATQSYERGNPAFAIERSTGVEAGIHYTGDRLLLAVTAYATNFTDFITPIPTGAEVDGFPVYQFTQTDARFRGIEAEGSATLARWGEGALKLDGAADYVHASLPGVGPVPRIPPLRARGGLEYGSPALTLRGEVEWNARQNRIATNEFPVGAFTLVNASATWRPAGAGGPLTLILSADNLLDVEGRRAASETRDFVPISGRDIRLTVQYRL